MREHHGGCWKLYNRSLWANSSHRGQWDRCQLHHRTILQTTTEDAALGAFTSEISTNNKPDDWGTSTYTIESGGDPDSKFDVDGTTLENGTFDFETATSHQVTITDTPSGPYDPIERTFTISVTDVEGPTTPSPAYITTIDDTTNVASGNTYSGGVWNGVSFGTAHANRIVILGIVCGGSTPSITGVTIGGVAATQIQVGSTTQVTMRAAAVPTGATGNIVITIGTATALDCNCSVFVGYPSSATKLDSAAGTATGTTPIVLNDLQIAAGGFLIYCGAALSGGAGRNYTNLERCRRR